MIKNKLKNGIIELDIDGAINLLITMNHPFCIRYLMYKHLLRRLDEYKYVTTIMIA